MSSLQNAKTRTKRRLAIVATVEAVEPEICDSADKLDTFVELARKHRTRLQWVAWRITKNHEEAEDIVQEALLRAFGALPRFRGDSRMETWLQSIVRNMALVHLRNRKGRVELPLEPVGENADTPALRFPDPAESPEEYCERRERETILRSSMGQVTSMCKVALQLCILEELPYRAVANDLNISIGTLKSRVFHGKRMLRQAVQRRIDPDDHINADLPVPGFEPLECLDAKSG